MDYATDPTFYGNQKQPLKKRFRVWYSIFTSLGQGKLLQLLPRWFAGSCLPGPAEVYGLMWPGLFWTEISLFTVVSRPQMDPNGIGSCMLVVLVVKFLFLEDIGSRLQAEGDLWNIVRYIVSIILVGIISWSFQNLIRDIAYLQGSLMIFRSPAWRLKTMLQKSGFRCRIGPKSCWRWADGRWWRVEVPVENYDLISLPKTFIGPVEKLELNSCSSKGSIKYHKIILHPLFLGGRRVQTYSSQPFMTS